VTITAPVPWHLALGMSPSPLDPMTLMVTLAELKAATQD
jgi:hypothetical protein